VCQPLILVCLAGIVACACESSVKSAEPPPAVVSPMVSSGFVSAHASTIVETREGMLAAWFAGTGLLLNEGGGGTETGGRPVFEVEVTQKVPLWIRLTSRDQPGHGSTPRPTSSVTRLIRALERLRTHEFEPRVLPAVDAYLRGRAAAGIGPFADRLADPAAAAAEDGFLARLQAENAFLAAILRNTCTITRLEGSSKINVVPPAARALKYATVASVTCPSRSASRVVIDGMTILLRSSTPPIDIGVNNAVMPRVPSPPVRARPLARAPVQCAGFPPP